MLGGLSALRNRWLRTAIWWGLAAAFKGPPILFAGYLLWRKRWLPALLMIAVAVAANVLPDLVHRPPDGKLWVTHWLRDYIAPITVSSRQHSQGLWYAGISDNQSLPGDIDRWFLTTTSPSPDGVHVAWRSNPIAPQPLREIVLTIEAMICLLAAWAVTPGHMRRWHDPRMPTRAAFEFGIVMLLILLLSPMSSRSLFCMMLLPAFCVARAAVQRNSSIAWLSILTAGALSFAKTFSHQTLWAGFSTLDTLALFAGSVWLLGSSASKSNPRKLAEQEPVPEQHPTPRAPQQPAAVTKSIPAIEL
jgi:hypothetical protein